MNSKKSSLIIIVLCGMIAFIMGVLFWKPSQIARVIVGVKQECNDYQEKKYRNKEKVSLENYNAIEDWDECWQYNVIAHGCGGIDGRVYTSSKEAMDLHYKNGTRLFDADVRFTSDGVLVLRHDWKDNLEQEGLLGENTAFKKDELKQSQIKQEDAPDSKTFNSTKVFKKYTSMTYEDAVNFLKEHKDARLVIDTKEDVADTYKYIVANTEEELLSQIIVSLYRFDDLEMVKNIYPFKYVMYRQHEVYPINYTELIAFCLEHNIQAVNINEKYFLQDDMSLFEKYNIKLYIAVTDSLKEYSEYRKMSGEQNRIGVVSNFIYENDMAYIQGEHK